jgi:small membrane protein
MIFQFLLTAGLLGIGFYVLARRRMAPLVGWVSLLVVVAAMFLVWHPGFAQRVAGWVGIGRGADLLFYCWIMISLLLIVNLHLRIRALAQITTELARSIALAHPMGEETSRGEIH